MKLKIFKEGKAEEREIFLDLRRNGENVDLIVCDRAGEKVDDGILLTFYADGTTHKNVGVNPNLGFKLDSLRRIVIDE